MQNDLDLVVVIPAYNEEACIRDVVPHWIDGIAKVIPVGSFKLLIINDGSRDNTGTILDELTGEYPNLIAKHQINGGHGNAIYNGYQMAVEMNPSFVFQTFDNQEPIKEKQVVLQLLPKGAMSRRRTYCLLPK